MKINDLFKVEKLENTTIDIVDNNIKIMEQLFPQVFTESVDENNNLVKKIDFNKLKQELSNELIDNKVESYEFTWVGKKEALLEANKKITKTLRPCIEESKNWDSTKNLYIEGDNLEVLKILQKSYFNKVKMIYIDPPYNTGSDSFTYNDNFTMDDEEYEEKTDYRDEENNKQIKKNKETNPTFHSVWCSMIYSRLKLAKNLLADDGVIFISIDDREQANLKKICDEVFGERNFIACLPRLTSSMGKNDEHLIANANDYLFCYSKNKDILDSFERKSDFDSLKDYKLEDNIGKYHLKNTLDVPGLPYSKSLDFTINFNNKNFNPIIHNSKKVCWRWSKNKVDFGIENNLIVEKNNRLYTKTYLEYEIIENNDGTYKIIKKTNIGGSYKTTELMNNEYGNRYGDKILTELKIPFKYPKPVSLIKFCLKLINDKNAIILDFFSGSATTAHAVMDLNAEDGGNRQFIMVQLQEECKEDSEAFKAGYKNICEIGKERIRRAGNKIVETTGKNDLDIGFRVFRVDSSNMEDVYYEPNNYSQEMLDGLVSNIKQDRTDEDLLFSCLLENGFPLTIEHKIEVVDNRKIYIIDNLVACFEKNINENVIRYIADLKPEIVFFRDGCFVDSAEKITADEIIKSKMNNCTIKVL